MSDPFAVPDGPLPGQDVDPDISPDPDGSGATDDTRHGDGDDRDADNGDADSGDADEDDVDLSDLP